MKKRQAISRNSEGLILQQWLLQAVPEISIELFHIYILLAWELSVNQPKVLKQKHNEHLSGKWE